MRGDRERLEDVLEAIERIERHTAAGRSAFDADELIQNWVVHHLEIIGEACTRVSADLRERNPEIPWRGYIGMRNILAHQYFGIDLDRSGSQRPPNSQGSRLPSPGFSPPLTTKTLRASTCLPRERGDVPYGRNRSASYRTIDSPSDP